MNVQKKEEELIEHLVAIEKITAAENKNREVDFSKWMIKNRQIVNQRKKFVNELKKAGLRAKMRNLRKNLDRLKGSEVKR